MSNEFDVMKWGGHWKKENKKAMKKMVELYYERPPIVVEKPPVVYDYDIYIETDSEE